MSEIWQSLIDLQNALIDKFAQSGKEIHEPGMEKFNQPGWVNRVWNSDTFRRAHIDVVDARNTKGLWMMHVCVFPHVTNAGPIYGLDVIAGKNKVTGFFHDLSPTVDQADPMIQEFGKEMDNHTWKKERDLPDWAKAIFSDHMLAVGNVNTTTELQSLISIGLASMDTWLTEIGSSAECDKQTGKDAQNRYAFFQKQNPHTPRTMTALGLDEDDVKHFIQECLFPELE